MELTRVEAHIPLGASYEALVRLQQNILQSTTALSSCTSIEYFINDDTHDIEYVNCVTYTYYVEEEMIAAQHVFLEEYMEQADVDYIRYYINNEEHTLGD